MTTKKAEKVIEVVEPVIEETIEVLETVERIPRLRLNGTTKKQQIIILGATAVAAGVVAGVAAWKIASKRAELKYEAIVEEQVNETRAFYQALQKPPIESLGMAVIPDDPQEQAHSQALADAVEAVQNYKGKVPYDKPEVSRVIAGEPEVEQHNVFVDGKPMEQSDWDYETEIAQRSEDTPYIISYDEFLQGEKDYIQARLTWYDGDDTLTDDEDKPIPDADTYVGEHNMHRFGHGSRDPNILYIRNDMKEIDFEVAKNTSGYASAVLGLRHSMDRPGSRKPRRMRGDDG